MPNGHSPRLPVPPTNHLNLKQINNCLINLMSSMAIGTITNSASRKRPQQQRPTTSLPQHQSTIRRSGLRQSNGDHHKLSDSPSPSRTTSTTSISPPSEVRTSQVSHLGGISQSPSQLDLKKEYIRFCKLYSSDPLDIVASPLEKASQGRDLIVVDLKGRGLRGVDCIALGRILGLDAPITELNLSDCLLLPQGFQALVDGICKNTRLRTLELRGNNIQATMTTNLGRLLKTNHQLKSLLLEWNCIGLSLDSFGAFCDGLTLNRGLEILDLRNNQLSGEAATKLAFALQKNKTLREVDLRWNSIGLSGAKSLWEALRFNLTLTKLSLGGNFIPEDVMKCIDHCIQQQSERETMMEEYSRRTTLLTRQLQRTEKSHAQEINTIVSVFDAEEAELKEALVESTNSVQNLTEQLRNETIRSNSLNLQIEKLRASLDCATEKEDTLKKALEIKEQHSEELEVLFRQEIEKMKTTNETKLKVTLEELEAKGREITAMRDKLRKLESDLEVKTTNVTCSHQEVNALQEQLQEQRQQFDERIRLEKEKWTNWKREIETSEKREIRTLEEEIRTIQETMMSHIKVIEKGKADAEEEIRNLKITFVTQKAEADEDMNRMRSKLKADFDQVVLTHASQVNMLKEKITILETELEEQRSGCRKLESENSTLVRQNENLRQQMTQRDLELSEKDSTINQSLARARSEVREQLDQLGKEESANKVLRAKTLDLQEKIATLTLTHGREMQERVSEAERWKIMLERREEELTRLKEEDMRRASLLHEAFLAYMRSTAAATGLPLPPSYYTSNPAGEFSKPASSGDAPDG